MRIERVECFLLELPLPRSILSGSTGRDGRPIEFCWRLGEDRISHWHETDAGFRARQPMDEEFLADLATEKSRV